MSATVALEPDTEFEVYRANVLVSVVVPIEFDVAPGQGAAREAYATARVALDLDAENRLPTGQRVILSISGLDRAESDHLG